MDVKDILTKRDNFNHYHSEYLDAVAYKTETLEMAPVDRNTGYADLSSFEERAVEGYEEAIAGAKKECQSILDSFDKDMAELEKLGEEYYRLNDKDGVKWVNEFESIVIKVFNSLESKAAIFE